MIQEKDTLWTRVMQAKYGRQRQGLNLIKPVKGSSFTWASLAKASSILNKGCAWNIKNGKGTKFWLDPWVLQVPLKEMVTGDIPPDLEEAAVANFTGVDGSWRTELFSNLLPSEIHQKILSIAVGKLSQEEDRLFWSGTADGRFSTKSAFALLTQRPPDPSEKIWKTIWRLPVPERIRTFMWQTFLGKIVTNVLRYSRKIASSPCCDQCTNQPESILHILRDCPPALFFWSRHVPIQRQQNFFSDPQEDWLRKNLLEEELMASDISWPAFFSMAAWLLCKNRCTAALRGKTTALSAPTLEHSIMTKAKMWHDSWHAPTLIPDSRARPAARQWENIGWSPPLEGWVTLNVDGASNGNPGPAGAGGVIRGSTGLWVGGFVANIGVGHGGSC
ncbi:unnamed protein product [Linum trigynum]|uniref:RNase H type-1 domain-containing protein n=1 Tax=Linum trigynum TaxID=586398 RepID=A0AAV2G958_9ROSI